MEKFYPSIAEVVKADREQVCRWVYGLRPPENALEERVLFLIRKKFNCLGGPTFEIARRLNKTRFSDGLPGISHPTRR